MYIVELDFDTNEALTDGQLERLDDWLIKTDNRGEQYYAGLEVWLRQILQLEEWRAEDEPAELTDEEWAAYWQWCDEQDEHRQVLDRVQELAFEEMVAVAS